MIRNPIHRKCLPAGPGEAGFTMIEVIVVVVLTSILATFVFGIISQSVGILVATGIRKERADDAVMALEKMSREIREAKIESVPLLVDSNTLEFEKNVPYEGTAYEEIGGEDPNEKIRFVLDTSTNKLMRQSAPAGGSLPGDSTSGNVLSMNVESFNVNYSADTVNIELVFSNGSTWHTVVRPRNME
jgi:prepilin-type N-terminal cleavage/methylation domain-containing protein